ncbi:tape measure protein [Dyadobacter sp. 676]|uniref:Tape measure protein n=1 Tax=Dyadobacter sp. 676 TaxID=3088362 RepID=A0AAU8FS52_9BACT
MRSSSGAIDFDSYLHTDNYAQGIKRIENLTRGVTKTVTTEADRMNATFSNLGRVAAGAFAGLQLAQLPQQIVRVRGEFQQLEISLNTMLQSKSKADNLTREIIQAAATTPFGLKDLSAGAKQLLAYGSAAETVVGEMRMIGDIAAGVSAPISDLIYLYGTLRTQGRAYAVDIRQFAGRGIPIYAELAKVLKVQVDEVNALVEAGKVGFPQVEQAFKNMTSAGGMFYNLTAEQSKSIPGLIERLKDGIDIAFNDIGKSNQGLIENIITGATTAVEHYQDILDVLKVVVASYGAYRAALILTTAAQSSSLILGEVQAFVALARSIRTAADAQALLNLVVRQNPYVIAATALAALVTGIIVFGKETDAATEAKEKLANAVRETESEINKEKASIAVLTQQLKDETKTREEKGKILKKLVDLNPEILSGITLENAATGRATELINEYIRAKREQIRVAQIQAKIEAELQNQLDIKSGKKDDELRMSFLPTAGLGMAATAAGMGGGSFNASKVIAQDLEQAKTAAIAKSKQVEKALLDELNSGIEQRRARRRKEIADIKEAGKMTVEAYDAQIKALQDVQKKATSKKEYDHIGNQIKILEAQRAKITGGKSAAAARASAENEKEVRVKTFAEELESKKQLYELYQRWIDSYGKAAADEQFASLISEQKTYVDYLNNEIARLEAMKDTGYVGKFSDQDAADLDNLLSLRRNALNQKTSVEQFKDELEEAKMEAKSLAEYLDVLYSKRGNVGDPDSASGQAKSVLLNSEIVETEKALKASLIEFQRESATYLQKRIQAEQKYNSLRKAAILKYSKDELKTELDNIEKRKKEELEAIADEELERTEAYQRIHEDIKQLSREQLKIRIDNIQQELKNEEISVKKRLELEKALARAKKALNNKSVEDLRIAGSVLSQALGDVTLEFTEQFKLNLRDLGNAIEGVANLASFDFSTASASDKASAIGDIIGIHSFLITTVRDAFKTTEDFYTGMEEHESYYKGLAAEIDGVNILLERQQYLLGNLTGSEKSGGTMALIESYAKAQEDALQGLKDLSIDVIKSADKVFVDPILGTEVKAKGFWGVYTQLATAGKAETKIKYKFENIDTSGYDDIEDFINLLAEIRKGGGKLNGKEVVAADLEALELLIKTYQEAEEKQKQLIDEFRQFLTATTETQIADAIVAGLQAGKSSAADFADDFETMMRNAVVNSLKAQIMDAKLADFYKKMGEYALSDGVISKDEQADLKKDWDGIITGSKQLADTIQEITGVDIAGSAANLNNSLSGSIKGMSEETASVLAGQFNAIRIYNAQMAFDVRSSLLVLTQISQNTSYTRKLIDVDDKLSKIIDQNNRSLRGFGF